MISENTALLVDFDNIFGGHYASEDPSTALEFGSKPRRWLEAVAAVAAGDRPIRWLTRTCYMNAGGTIVRRDPKEGETSRIYFSEFRSNFLNAGFQVVDAAPLARGKNAADVRMAVDAMDLLASGRIEHLVMASGDSDMTPVLTRMRSAGIRTTIITTLPATQAYRAAADRVLFEEDALRLIHSRPRTELERARDALTLSTTLGHGPEANLRAYVIAAYGASTAPIRLQALLADLRQFYGHTIGAALQDVPSLRNAVAEMGLPHAQLWHSWLFDTERHSLPCHLQSTSTRPASLNCLQYASDLPQLRRPVLMSVFDVIADHASQNGLDLGPDTLTQIESALVERGRKVTKEHLQAIVSRLVEAGVSAEPTPASARALTEVYLHASLEVAAARAHPVDEAMVVELRTWIGLERTGVRDDVTRQEVSAGDL